MRGRIPKAVEARIKRELKKYQKVLKNAKARDVNETDTIIIVSDILSDVLGFDKYSEITTEFAIRGTYVDLAIKTGDEIYYLIEVKAIGLDLKESHLKQAIDYAANQGIDWVVLTNGELWQVYKVLYNKPIDTEKTFDFNLIEFSARDTETIYELYTLSREGVRKSAISELHEKAKATNKFAIAAILRTEPVLNAIAREIRKINKTIKIDKEHLKTIIEKDVLKRDVREGEAAEKAIHLVKTSQQKAARKRAKKVKENTTTRSESTSRLPAPAGLMTISKAID